MKIPRNIRLTGQVEFNPRQLRRVDQVLNNVSRFLIPSANAKTTHNYIKAFDHRFVE